jgi:hypothetical protein
VLSSRLTSRQESLPVLGGSILGSVPVGKVVYYRDGVHRVPGIAGILTGTTRVYTRDGTCR